MIWIGIDPGKSGAIAAIRSAFIDCAESEGIFWCKGDQTEADQAAWLRTMTTATESFALIERVHAMPGQGVSSCFTFGRSYGFLRGLLIAYQIPFEEVQPAKWQAALSCLSKGQKNITKAKAQQLFPRVKVTHAIADALLLAEHCRRTHQQGG